MDTKQTKTEQATSDHDVTHDRVNRCVSDRLTGCSCAYFLQSLSWSIDDGQLTVTGRVPTFQLKQMVETLLRDIPQVDTLVNKVDVVSSTGLSTTQPE